MKRRSLLPAILLLPLISCTEADGKFPDKVDSSSLKRSEFVPTIEHQLPNHKNAIYSSTLLLAWNEIRQAVKKPIVVESSNNDLALINKSTSFVGTLSETEYEANGEIEGDQVKLQAAFQKSLPFAYKLQTFADKLTFNGHKIASFGKVGTYDAAFEIISILYFKNNDNFIIRLSPKEKAHEIILIKASNRYNNIKEILRDIETKVIIGNKERKSEKTSWRYILEDYDEVLIPKFRFNIEHNYPSLAGNKINVANRIYIIEEAKQKTAFVLNESGAELDSEAEIDITTEEDETKTRPKIMRFDKPFFLMLRKRDSKYPYFGLWVNNTELMEVGNNSR